MPERIKSLNSRDARILGTVLGFGILSATNYVPELESAAKKILMSTNENDYSIVTGINGTDCYTKNYPTFSNSLQTIQLREAFCPNGIKGETKFVELELPSSSLTNVPSKK